MNAFLRALLAFVRSDDRADHAEAVAYAMRAAAIARRLGAPDLDVVARLLDLDPVELDVLLDDDALMREAVLRGMS